MKHTAVAFGVIALGVAIVSGCATNTQTGASTEAPAAASTQSAGSSSGASATSPSDATTPQADPTKTVHFEFDSSVLDDANRKVVEANADYLRSHPNAKIRVEGHADERGTREYNLALGERRAQAVAKVLRVLGVSGDRVEIRSYGEERPVATGHDETAWAQNRRDEFVYRQ